MNIWPQDYSSAWTLAAETSRYGVGLHSGAEATVELRPTDQPGFHIRLPEMEKPIQLRPDQVRDSPLCTTLDLGSSKVSTVEHLLAALARAANRCSTVETLLEPRSKVVHNGLSRT